MRLHPNAVAKHGPSAEGARWVDGENAYCSPPTTPLAGQAIDKRTLPYARCTRHANDLCSATMTEQAPDQHRTLDRSVFDQRDTAGYGPLVAGEDTFREAFSRHVVFRVQSG